MSVALVTDKFDRGPVVARGSFAIDDEVTASEVYDLMKPLAAGMLLDVVKTYARNGRLRGEVQPQMQVIPDAPKPDEENTRIYWDEHAKDIHNLVRGWNEMAYAYTYIDREKLLISRTEVVHPYGDGDYGEVVRYRKDGFEVCCASGNILVLEARDENERRYNMPRLIERLKKQDPVFLGD